MNDDNSDIECHPVAVAAGAIGSVNACRGCGCVHLTLQHLTLRFTPVAFRELTALTLLAQRQLDGQVAARHGSTSVDAHTTTH